MNFQDCISTATQAAVDQDAPDHLLPLLIANQAALLSREPEDRAEMTCWH
ncbi:hypothetical protein J7U46_20860 [Pelomonas sp. V22]|nr:hypothetical protein [Pelomonas sp. V22]MDI4635527.1 hypothetical protein [Pelomonas sp. V22]